MRKLFRNIWLQVILLLVVSLVLIYLPRFFGFVESEKAEQWVDFIGSFHPLVLHLPIGILSLLVVLEIVHVFNNKIKFPRMLILLVLALSSISAAVFGFIWYLTGDWKGDDMISHMNKGLWFAAAIPWVAWLYYHSKKYTLMIYYVAMLASLGLMCAASHEGGEIVHGDPFDRAPWNQEDTKKPEISGADDSSLKGMLVYEDLVVPILKEKCYSCHDDGKQKGALRLDTIDYMLEGGDNDIALEKGDAEASPLITTILLPIDKDEHMPPENEPQITESELAILTWWVNQGADSGKKIEDYPEDKSFTDSVRLYLSE